jgi:hypothetical protein
MQQAETSVSRHRHAVSWPVTQGGRGRLATAKPLSPPAARAPTLGGSRRCGCAVPHPLVRGRLGPNYDVRSVIHSRQLARHGADVDPAAVNVAKAHQPKGEHEEAPPRRGGRPCDQDGDRSPTADGPSPRAFGHRILKVPFPPCFRQPTNITKYTGETNHAVWLENFWLACWAGGADDDYFIIQYLPICVGEYVRVWLKFLPPNSNCKWVELKQVFIGNFQGMYMRPENF